MIGNYVMDADHPKLDELIKFFKALSDEERYIIMHTACYYCGTTKLPCHCWNDE